MEAKTESSVVYDERRKVMTQKFKSFHEMKTAEGKVVGKVNLVRTATFDEHGIKDTLKDLSNQRTKIEQTIKQIKENIKDIKLTPDLEELEKNIKLINDFNKSNQSKSQLESQEEELKIVRQDILDIKGAIGSRLKL